MTQIIITLMICILFTMGALLVVPYVFDLICWILMCIHYWMEKDE